MENQVIQNEELLNRSLDLMNEYSLNWDVEKLPLCTQDENAFPTGSFGIFRKDNNQWLSTQGKNYVPLQNFDLISSAVIASSNMSDFNIENAKGGVLKNGRKVFIQIPIEDEEVGNSKIKRWITALNSHDGSSCVAFGSQQTVVICENTFYKAYKNLNHVRHNLNAKEKLFAMAEDLNKSLQEDALLIEQFKRWADIQVEPRHISQLVNSMVAVSNETQDNSGLDISTRKKNQIVAINRAIQLEFSLEGENLWGLFNGATRYTNHSMNRGKSELEKKESLMIGGGARLNEVAFKKIELIVNNN
jgi:hypothetical protein